MKIFKTFVCFRVLLAMCASLIAVHVQAAVFFVTDTNDSIKPTSLRGAVMAANQNGENNTIFLGQPLLKGHIQQHQWIYRLTISGADEDAARTGDLDITRGRLSIVGINPNVTIDAAGLGDRVFQVFPHAHLALSNLTIENGSAPQAQAGSFYSSTLGPENGGAIYNAGVLTLIDCIITNNSSGGGNFNPGNGGGIGGADGGGVYNSGTLQAIACSIVGNVAGIGFDGAQGGNGGGIKNDGVCSLTSCIIGGNQSGAGGTPAGNAFGFGGSGGNGGGICNAGTMILNECIVCANFNGQAAASMGPGIGFVGSPGAGGGSGGNGAGIFNAGQMHLNFSAVYDNYCSPAGDGGSLGSGGQGGAGGSGGGIFNAGALSLDTSTISENAAGNGGNGGEGFMQSGGTGGSGGSGGGICNVGSFDSISSTIVSNQTGAGGNAGNGVDFYDATSPAVGGAGGNGGGVWNDSNATNITRNTLIALNAVNAGGTGGTNTSPIFQLGLPQPSPVIGNEGANGIGSDVGGDFTSQGFNLIGSADGSFGFTNGMNADQAGSDANPINPLIGPLQMNGGVTPTHALLSGSPAIDQGKSFGIHTDQRGHHRPHDYPLIPNALGGDGGDIGAFELDAP